MSRGVLAVAALIAAAACSPSGSPAASGATPSPDALRVVATTTVLADIVKQVGGPNVTPRASSRRAPVETFDPSPQDVAALSDADLVVMNGLGLDEWLEPVIAPAAPDVPVVRLAELLPDVEYVTDDEAGEAANPHLWLDVGYAEAVRRGGSRTLGRRRSGSRCGVPRGGDDYGARLAELDAWVREQIDTIPPDNRKLSRSMRRSRTSPGRLDIVGSVVGVPARTRRRARSPRSSMRSGLREGGLHGSPVQPAARRGDRPGGRSRGRERPLQRLRSATRRSTPTKD